MVDLLSEGFGTQGVGEMLQRFQPRALLRSGFSPTLRADRLSRTFGGPHDCVGGFHGIEVRPIDSERFAIT